MLCPCHAQTVLSPSCKSGWQPEKDPTANPVV